MIMTMVEGYSDDTIMVTQGKKQTTIDCWDKIVTIYFTDGTIIQAEYLEGAWQITIEEQGSSRFFFSEEQDRAGDKLTDVFLIDAAMCLWELTERSDDCVGEV